MSIETILVGVDHSDRSDKALRKANEIALLHDARLVIEHALDVGSAEKLRGLLERVAIEETTERAASVFGEHAAPYLVRATAGRAYEVLRDVGKAEDADLIVLGVHRREKGATIFSGSTARRLINEAPAPVLVVTNEPQGAYKRILIGYDDSPAARKALRFIRALAPRAKLTIVTACMIPFSARNVESSLVAQFEKDARQRVIEALGRDGHGPADASGIEIITRVGEAYGVITDVLRERGADLLVLGAAMPALFRQVFGGGIIDLIATDPPCDLLVVKI